MYLRTARLDLDDYNNDTEDGCHITSMSGSWMAIIMGFAGMKIIDDKLSLRPYCPDQWQGYQFNLKFRGRDLQIKITATQINIFNQGADLDILIDNRNHLIPVASVTTITLRN